MNHMRVDIGCGADMAVVGDDDDDGDEDVNHAEH